MKKYAIFALIAISSARTAFGQQIQTTYSSNRQIFKGSVATTSQLIEIETAISAWVESKQTPAERNAPFDSKLIEKNKAEFLSFVNALLSSRGLPQIDTHAKNLKIDYAILMGIHAGPHDFEGVDITDGKNKFCLPCEIGHNNFTNGVIAFSEAKRNTSGPFSGTLSCFTALDGIAENEQNYVNSANLPGTKFIAIPGSNAGREGFYAVTDNGMYFYPATLPKGFAGQKRFVPATLPDGTTYQKPLDPLVMYKNYRITLPGGTQTTVNLDVNPFPKEHVIANEITFGNGLEGTDFGTSNQPPTDLGVGAGDKTAGEAQQVLSEELSRRLELLTTDPLPGGHARSPSSSQLCPALDACRKDPVLSQRADASAQLSSFQQKFSCQTNTAVVQDAPQTPSRESSGSSAEVAL